MSLAETQQLFNLLTEIDKILGEIQLKQDQINRDVPRTREALQIFNKLEAVAFRYATIAQKIAGSEESETVIMQLTKILMIMRQIQIAGSLIAGGVATGGVLGAIGVVGGVGALVITELTIMEGY